jgi:hypothetical protein
MPVEISCKSLLPVLHHRHTDNHIQRPIPHNPVISHLPPSRASLHIRLFIPILRNGFLAFQSPLWSPFHLCGRFLPMGIYFVPRNVSSGTSYRIRDYNPRSEIRILLFIPTDHCKRLVSHSFLISLGTS